jgi:predicted DNA-binding transcriptional regulator AlpA
MFGRRLVKFNDLKARQIAKNHPSLKDLIEKHGFPPGFWTGPNTHAWWEDEVEMWLAARPTTRPTEWSPRPRRKTWPVKRDKICIGHVRLLDPEGVEAFDANDRSLGVYPDRKSATDAVERAAAQGHMPSP